MSDMEAKSNECDCLTKQINDLTSESDSLNAANVKLNIELVSGASGSRMCFTTPIKPSSLVKLSIDLLRCSQSQVNPLFHSLSFMLGALWLCSPS